jgi:hypothetical protein
MIYEIVCNITNEKYYGSTKSNIARRMYSHKTASSKCTSRQIIDRGDYIFRVLETLDNPTKIELWAKEKEYIKNNECINKLIPAQTEEELKANIIFRNGKYYLDNKEELLNQQKKYYFDNKNRITSRVKKYYNDNKEVIQAVRKEKLICECGDAYTIQNRARHCKTKKHINFIGTK